MFIRRAQHLKSFKRFTSLPQRFNISTCMQQNYATVGSWTRTGELAFMQRIQCFSITSTKWPTLQQVKPDIEAEKPSKLSHEQVIRRLESFYQRNGFIDAEQLQPLMVLIKSEPNIKLTCEQSLFLLNTFACETPSLTKELRIEHFTTLWQHLKANNLITKDHYHAMLHVLAYNRAPLSDYKLFLAEYEQHQGSSKDILSNVLAVSGASGNVRQATDILAQMRQLGMALGESDFNSLLLAHGRANDMEGFQTVLDSMSAAGVTISNETATTLILTFMENGIMTKVMNTLQQYSGHFQPKQIANILRIVNECPEVPHEVVALLIKELKADYLRGPEVPLEIKLSCLELIHNKKLDYVKTIIDTLPAPDFQDHQDIDTYAVFLLHALFQSNYELSKIIEIASHLEDTNKNSCALHIATGIALRRSPPMALPMFEALVKRNYTLRTHYFWPLMMYNFRRHSEAGVLRTLKIMQDFKVECDHQTLVQYVIPRLSVTLTNAAVALKQLDEVGVKTSLAMMPIVLHLLTQNKWSDVTPLVDAYPTRLATSELIGPLCAAAVNARATKRLQYFAKLLQAIANKNIDRKQDFAGQFLVELLSTQGRVRSDHICVQRLLNDMKKNGLKISPSAMSTILSLLVSRNNDAETSKPLQAIQQSLRDMTNRSLEFNDSSENDLSSSFIKHPRDMSIDELECHLVELEAKQMNTRGVLRRLLQLSVRDNRLERAMEIKAKCDELRVQSSPGMLASVFELYTKKRDLVNAEKSLQQLQKTYPGFQVDEHKFVDFATLLVSFNKLDAAKNLLEERSLKHKIVGGDYILKNVWNLLTHVAQLAAQMPDLSPDRNLTRETYAFLQKLGYCRTHNAILGPIIRERLLRSDLPAAIAEFKQLAQQYKHTPLQFELLSLLVKLCNGSDDLRSQYNCDGEQAQKLLSEVTEIITRVHGAVNMNSGLVLAFAESGSDNQLRRLLINPEFQINEELLVRNCEHLGQEGAVQTLLRLARGARGLHRVIDEERIYKMLLNNFVKSNDCQAALNLYEHLENDDELKITQDFLRTLVNLLKTNNVEIPSNIALKARIAL